MVAEIAALKNEMWAKTKRNRLLTGQAVLS